METEKVFANGFVFKKPHDKAPDFIKGNLSIKVDDAIAFLQENKKSDGWVNIDLKKSKGGKLYLELNTWSKKEAESDGNPF